MCIKIEKNRKKKGILFFLMIGGLFFGNTNGALVFFNAQSLPQALQENNRPRILSVFTSKWMGGAEVCALWLHKLLYVDNKKSLMLVQSKSLLHDELVKADMPHYTMDSLSGKESSEIRAAWAQALAKICREHEIEIILCHTLYQAQLTKSIMGRSRVKVVLMYHGIDDVNFERMRRFDGVLTVNPRNLPLLEEKNKTLNLGIKKIDQVYPFFNEAPFLQYKPDDLSRELFFHKQGFDLQKKGAPVICMIANFYGPLKDELEHHGTRKNHELLLKALHILIHKRGKVAYVVFLGDGGDRPWHEQRAQELDIAQYVFFAGFQKNVEQFLYHSDIHALTSRDEPFGIVYLEAGLMKKPSIGASGTGAEYALRDGVTGLIFKNNDCEDLVKKLQQLIDDPKKRQQMGENGYRFVREEKSRPFLAAQKIKIVRSFFDGL